MPLPPNKLSPAAARSGGLNPVPNVMFREFAPAPGRSGLMGLSPRSRDEARSSAYGWMRDGDCEHILRKPE